MANKISSRATGPGNIKSIAINSNSSEKKTLDLVSFGPPVVFASPASPPIKILS